MPKQREVDPVLKCTDCQRLVEITELHTHGQCMVCGCKRMKSVKVLDDEVPEHARLMEKYPEWAAEFGPVEPATEEVPSE
jgi:DNA-directed RNA polymerase subunit RPC12/RpoP